jgi:hypothetical protein
VDSTPDSLNATPPHRPGRLSSPAGDSASLPPSWARLLTLREAALVLRVDPEVLQMEAVSGSLPTSSVRGMLYVDGARLFEAFRCPVDPLPTRLWPR